MEYNFHILKYCCLHFFNKEKINFVWHKIHIIKTWILQAMQVTEFYKTHKRRYAYSKLGYTFQIAFYKACLWKALYSLNHPALKNFLHQTLNSLYLVPQY